LEANICANNEWAGVAYSDTSAGAARQNECVGNEVGLFVDETADPELDDNDCHDNTETDIRDLR
jgi:nitrous oxidase accessory protein NosD